MEISSSGAGSLAQISPTQTGSVQQVKRAAQQDILETPPVQEVKPSSSEQDQRVGSLINISV